MRKKNIIIACCLIAAIPLLLVLQQRLMPRTSPPEPRHLLPRINMKLLQATEKGLECHKNNAAHVAYAAAIYASQGKHATAEKWLLLGAREFRYPSIMLFYGDYLVDRKRLHHAGRWYRLALQYGKQDGQKQFCDFVSKRLEILDKMTGKGQGK